MTEQPTAAVSFPLFSRLPAELRRQIWIEALSEWSVWSVDWSDLGYARGYSPTKGYDLGYIGPAPHMAGLACRQARALLKEIYGRPISLTGLDMVKYMGCQWINLDRTVIHLGSDSYVRNLLRKSRFTGLPHFRHVAVWAWPNPHKLPQVCKDFVEICPSVRTIIFGSDKARLRPVSDEERMIIMSYYHGNWPLEPAIAAYYATLPEWIESRLTSEEKASGDLRVCLPMYDGEPDPVVHLVSRLSAYLAPR